MSVILVDVDGVIADFAQVYLNILNRQTGRNHVVEDITSWDFYECVASRYEDAKVWAHISDTPGLVSNSVGADLLGLNATWRLRDARHRVIAVTTPRWHCPRWMPERALWLMNRGFTESDICFVSDKAIVQGDILVDDGPHNITAWQAKHPNGRAILVSRPWNVAFEWADRITSLEEIV